MRTITRTLALSLAIAALLAGGAGASDADALRGPAVTLERVPTVPAQYTADEADTSALPPPRRHAMLMDAVRSLDLRPDQRRVIGAQDREYRQLVQAHRRTHAEAYALAREAAQAQREGRPAPQGAADAPGVRQLEHGAPSPEAHHGAIWEALDEAQRQAVRDHLQAQRDETIRRVQTRRAADRMAERGDETAPMGGRMGADGDDMSPGDPEKALERARRRIASMPARQRGALERIIERAERAEPRGEPKPPPSMREVRVPSP